VPGLAGGCHHSVGSIELAQVLTESVLSFRVLGRVHPDVRLPFPVRPSIAGHGVDGGIEPVTASVANHSVGVGTRA
jgi:hypothetical protein